MGSICLSSSPEESYSMGGTQSQGAGQHDTDQNPSGPSTSTSQTAEEQVDVKVVVTPDEVASKAENPGKVANPIEGGTFLKAGGKHTMLIEAGRVTKENLPKPRPAKYEDRWDQDHVKMPCSAKHGYTDRKSVRQETRPVWTLIEHALVQTMDNSYDLEHAIMEYNKNYRGRWDFEGLHEFFRRWEPEKREEFFNKTLPRMADLVLDMKTICTQPIPLLKLWKPDTITMSKQQVACLLANAFFCTFPRRNAQHERSEYSAYPTINFSTLFMKDHHGGTKAEKLKCLLQYFNRVTTKMPKGTVSFQRKVLDSEPDWGKSQALLTSFDVQEYGSIEDAKDKLQVDFANKFVGGGVLGSGCVQEEIWFVICPEMMVSRLFTEVLEQKESLLITGCERYSRCTGYKRSFQWQGNYDDDRLRDNQGRLQSEVICIDAVDYNATGMHPQCQYDQPNLLREINKAFCGFSPVIDTVLKYAPVATGNWGCGVLGGDPRLKALIQLMAASEAKRDVFYYTFNDRDLSVDLCQVYEFLNKKSVCVGDLFQSILKFQTSKQHSIDVLWFVKDNLERQFETSQSDSAQENMSSRPEEGAKVDINKNTVEEPKEDYEAERDMDPKANTTTDPKQRRKETTAPEKQKSGHTANLAHLPTDASSSEDVTNYKDSGSDRSLNSEKRSDAETTNVTHAKHTPEQTQQKTVEDDNQHCASTTASNTETIQGGPNGSPKDGPKNAPKGALNDADIEAKDERSDQSAANMDTGL